MRKNKCWNRVERALKKRDRRMYYAGGTLIIDWDEDKGGIALNLDGFGFVFGTIERTLNPKVVQPKYILELVHRFYRDTKGETEHYTTQTEDLL